MQRRVAKNRALSPMRESRDGWQIIMEDILYKFYLYAHIIYILCKYKFHSFLLWAAWIRSNPFRN